MSASDCDLNEPSAELPRDDVFDLSSSITAKKKKELKRGILHGISNMKHDDFQNICLFYLLYFIIMNLMALIINCINVELTIDF